MMLTIRLKEEEKRLLEKAGRLYGKKRSRSALVREALVCYWSPKVKTRKGSFYDAIKDDVGKFPSGRSDLATKSSELFYQYLVAKHRRHR